MAELNFQHAWKRAWFGPEVFLPGAGATDAAPNTVTTVQLNSGHTTGIAIGEINSLKLNSYKLNTNGNLVRAITQIPDVNTAAPVLARVVWTSGSSTAADTIDWKVSVKVQTADAALIVSSLTTVTLSDTALATAYCLQRTPAGTFAAGVIDNMDIFVLQVEMHAKAVGLSEDIFFLGVELLYVPVVVSDLGLGLPSLPSGWPGS
jgi:hypothetical protein